ncbi:hypothetical protein M5362_25995 [Streptomyces sp. Je 1-79]|uniref:hypothetical protein n=1 Tax=Streptomyces sp. Je 1-79 TaxID=2943847 RepID=UPI0021A4453D|nr:hypothetical protein [Streptomyces sp. Je 1-79]MCT4356583.1 hypothetical protein [Streptomyces sp. Je 1-79]
MVMKKIGRILASAAVLVGVGVVAPVATAGPAAAGGYGCNGTLIDSIPHTAYGTGERIGTTYLYWDGTYNCAALVKQGSLYGVKTRMALSLGTDTELKGDPGHYQYYAGPVKVYGKGKCIFTEGTLWGANGHELSQGRAPAHGYFHCG